MNFSEKLQCLRKGKNLSQEELAEIMNVSRQSVSKWELEQSFPEIEKLIDISNYFSVSLDSLVKDDKVVSEETVEIKEVEPKNNILQSKIKRRILLALACICISICFSVLTTIDKSRSVYQAVILLIFCILGISSSLYVGLKIRKYHYKN